MEPVDHAEARFDDLVATLRQALTIDSVSSAPARGAPFGAGTRAALDAFLEDAGRLGLGVLNDDGYAGHAEWGDGPELVGILGHLDVVPAGDGWTHPPFGGVLAADRIYGRGAADDKGPTYAALFALDAVRRSGIQPKRRVRLIVGLDEESGWRCLEHYFTHHPRPDLGFSPDGDFPLINREKGLVDLEFSAPGHGLDGPVHLVSLHGGLRPNMVPDAAQAHLTGGAADVEQLAHALERDPQRRDLAVARVPGGLRVTARGISAHGSTPEAGRNAAVILLSALDRLGLGEGPTRDWIRFTLGRLAPTDGSGLGIRMSDELSGPLTANLGVVRMDHEGFAAQVNVRYPVTFALDAVLGPAAGVARSAGVRMGHQHHRPPLHVPETSPLVQTLLQAYRAERPDSTLGPIAVGGATYARMVPNTVAFGAVEPGGPMVMHQADEFITLDNLRLALRVYTRAIAELVS